MITYIGTLTSNMLYAQRKIVPYKFDIGPDGFAVVVVVVVSSSAALTPSFACSLPDLSSSPREVEEFKEFELVRDVPLLTLGLISTSGFHALVSKETT